MTQQRLRDVRDSADATADQLLEGDGSDDAQDELESLLGELGGSKAEDVVVIVAKYDPKSTKRHGFDYCAKYPLAGFDPFALPAEWGPGNFRMRFCRAGRIFKVMERSFLAPLRPQGATPAASPASDELKASREFERNLILALIGRGGLPAAAAPAAPAVTVADMLSMFRAGLESAKATPMPLDQLREAIKLGRELSGAAPSDDDDEDAPRRGAKPSLLDRFGPQLLGIFERAMATPAPAPPLAIDAPGDPTAPPVTDPPAEPTPPAAEDPLRALVKSQAGAMIAEAKAGRDARAWGAFVAERCPEKFREHLHRFANAEDSERQAFLADVAPELIAYREWVNLACDGMLDVFDPEGDAPEDEGGAGDAP